MVIARPMDLASIVAVTDFHDFHDPGPVRGFGQGIALADLRRWLGGLVLLDYFTYSFRGISWNALSEREKGEEALWLAAGDTHGGEFASVWRKPPTISEPELSPAKAATRGA
jgi:hypothetical protein